MKTKILMFVLVVVLMLPMVVAAQGANPCTGNIPGTDTRVAGDIGACISQVYVWSLGISGLLAVVMTVFGGYLVMTARGNGQQAAKGKSYIFSSLVGLVMLMGAYLLLSTINTDLTDFSTDLDSVQSTTPPATGGSTTTPPGN